MRKNRILSTIIVCLLCASTGKAALLTAPYMDPAGEFAAPLQNDPIEYCDSTAYCFQQSQCGDSNCQNAVVLCHQICEAAFNTMTSAYATPPIHLGSYNAGSIRGMLGTLNCASGDYISYTEASGTIILSPASSVASFSPGSGKGRYSVAFFEGVLRQYKPEDSDIFNFYKVKDANGVESIGLKLTKGNVDVFFSDVSGMYP